MNIHPFPNAVNYFLRYYFIPLKKYTTLLIFYSALPQLRLQNFNRARNCTKFVKYSIRSIVYFYLYVYEKPSDFITRHPHRHHRPHPHDVSEILIADGICVRAGHHCAQPLLNYLGISSATRASFMFYNTEEEADQFVASIASIRERMGYGK
jgi:selenocysteine lyase/cysteine desulfurase